MALDDNLGAEKSVAPAGDCPEIPEGDVFSTALKNIESEPVAYLEQWDTECWIYVEADSLLEIN